MTTIAKYGIITENDAIIDAAALMSKKKRDFNLVINKNGEYIGVVTKNIISNAFGTGDITKATKILKISDILLKSSVIKILQTTSMDIVNKSLEENSAIILVINNNSKIIGVYNWENIPGRI